MKKKKPNKLERLKTKIACLRFRIAELEKSEARCKKAESKLKTERDYIYKIINTIADPIF